MVLPYNLTMSKFSLVLLPPLATIFLFHKSPNQDNPSKNPILKHTTRSIHIIIVCIAFTLLYSYFSNTSASLNYSLTLALILILLLTLSFFITSTFSTQNHRVIKPLNQTKILKHQADHRLLSGLLKLPTTLLAQTITNYQIKVTNLSSVRKWFRTLSGLQHSERQFGTFVAATALIVMFVLASTPVIANKPTPPAYKIQFVNLDSTSDAKPPQTTSTSLKQIQDFTFTISDLSIDFQTPTPNTLTTRSNTLTISSLGTSGYSVTAAANHPLKLQASTTNIPNTSCDNNDCDPSIAAPWTKTTTHGFGFNLTGDNLTPDFKDSSFFRPFSNQTPPIIMTSNQPTIKTTATVTYQLNLPATQAAGSYTNQINYVALPTY